MSSELFNNMHVIKSTPNRKFKVLSDSNTSIKSIQQKCMRNYRILDRFLCF